MDTFINLPLRDRQELISQTAAKMDMPPAAIEKDFWVCWMLQRLFQSPLRESIIFKGGQAYPKYMELLNGFQKILI